MSDSSLSQIEKNTEMLKQYKASIEKKLLLRGIHKDLIEMISEVIDFAHTSGELTGRVSVMRSFKSEFEIDEKT